MKVLNVTHILDARLGGGAAERTFQISAHLAKAGIQSSILTMDTGINKKRIESLGGVNVIALPYFFERFYIPKCSFNRIKQVVAKTDVVHLINHWTIINALVYHACKQLKKPYAVCPAGALPI